MQVPPCDYLSFFIKHYLWIESSEFYKQKARLFPDGNTGLVFSFSEISSNDHKSRLIENKVTIYGQVNQYVDFTFEKDISLLVVVFRPFGLSHFGISASELTGQFVNAEDLLGSEINSLFQHLGNVPLKQKFLLLDDYFKRKLVGLKEVIPQELGTAIRGIMARRGVMEVGALSEDLGIGQRKLERQFKQFVGLTPKGFMGVVRLHYLLSHMRLGPELNLTRLSIQCGYFDQSHAIREFRKITGLSPGIYRRETQSLAVNFVAL